MKIDLSHMTKTSASIGSVMSKIWSPGSAMADIAMRSHSLRRKARLKLLSGAKSLRSTRDASRASLDAARSRVRIANSNVARYQNPGFIEKATGGHWGRKSRMTNLQHARADLSDSNVALKKARSQVANAGKDYKKQLGNLRSEYFESVSKLGPASNLSDLRRGAKMLNYAARGTIVGGGALAGSSVISGIKSGQNNQYRGYR